MAPEPNRSVKFRAALKREIPVLIQRGILTEEGASKITSLYEFDDIGKESSRLLAAVLFTLASLLIGGGVISFVAAHWNEISRGPKVALLFGTLLAFYIAGYWFKYRSGWPRLGHALIFCGCLIFGANIGLLAQIYQVSGSWYGLFGVWAVGVLLMSWAVRSWITGVLVIVTSLVWMVGFANDYHERLATVYPFLLAITLLPLAWVIRSRVLYTLTFLGLICALPALAIAQLSADGYMLIALAAGGFLSWAVGEFHRATGLREEFGTPLVNLGIAALASGAFLWSFKHMWHWLDLGDPNQFYWLIPAGCAVAAGVAAIARAWPKMDGSQRRFALGAIMVFVLVCLAMPSYRFNRVLPVIITNLAALVIAGVCIGRGILEERRLIFWAGSLYVATLVISRFFEYESSLLLKSVAFILCGIITMIAGIAYERFLHRREAVVQ
ncbi:MAG: DUF2157 domain-containing protein [Acidobacteria bacterium]|nr:DUF2157 domain-containing protein [Acidobacteriota bacterium]